MWLGTTPYSTKQQFVPRDPFIAKQQKDRRIAEADAAHSKHLSNNCPHITGYKETRKHINTPIH